MLSSTLLELLLSTFSGLGFSSSAAIKNSCNILRYGTETCMSDASVFVKTSSLFQLLVKSLDFLVGTFVFYGSGYNFEKHVHLCIVFPFFTPVVSPVCVCLCAW